MRSFARSWQATDSFTRSVFRSFDAQATLPHALKHCFYGVAECVGTKPLVTKDVHNVGIRQLGFKVA